MGDSQQWSAPPQNSELHRGMCDDNVYRIPLKIILSTLYEISTTDSIFLSQHAVML